MSDGFRQLDRAPASPFISALSAESGRPTGALHSPDEATRAHRYSREPGTFEAMWMTPMASTQKMTG